ncbi:MAG: alpha/beta hydrolase family esterase [Solimonas sp.]
MRTTLAASLLAALALSACGGSSGSSGSSGGSPQAAKRCQEAFSPEKLAAGQDCAPAAGSFCPIDERSNAMQRDPVPCDGVLVESQTVSAAGSSSRYLSFRPDHGEPQAVVLALHYLQGSIGTFANVVRLPELAKGRQVLVVAPQAPGSLLSRWPTTGDDIAAVAAWLHAVVADARARHAVPEDAPLYIMGLSNGATMAYSYACLYGDEVQAILAAAAGPAVSVMQACAPAQPYGLVVVHGTDDVANPYHGRPGQTLGAPELYADFKQRSGCAGDAGSVAVPRTLDDLAVTIAYTGECSSGRRDFLVTVDGGGHNWPGWYGKGSWLEETGLFGGHTSNFDATLQGYDLLQLAAGR